MRNILYLFLDESGDLGFSPKGSRFFVLTSVALQRPFNVSNALDDYRYTCLEQGFEIEYFHGADDRRHVRDSVFDLIGAELPVGTVDSIIVEKAKTGPALQVEDRFFPQMLGHLLKFVLRRKMARDADDIVVIYDTPPLQRRRQSIEKTTKVTLANMLPKGTRYQLLHHQSRSHYGLQVADYCSWALFRKYERGDTSSYEKIRRSIWSEFDIFHFGSTRYY